MKEKTELYLQIENNKVIQTCNIFAPEIGCDFKAPDNCPGDPIGMLFTDGEFIDPNVKETTQENSSIDTYGNIWVREVIFKKKGEMKMGHKHNFDHLHFLAKGSARFTIHDGTDFYTTERTAPAWLKVPKNFPHQVEALEDDTAGYCIEALYSKNNKILDSDITFDPTQFDKMVDFTCETSVPSDIKLTEYDLGD